MAKYILISENGEEFPITDTLMMTLYRNSYDTINKVSFESYCSKLVQKGSLRIDYDLESFYLYRNQETNLLEVLAVGKLLALFQVSDDKKNGSDLTDYITDNIKAGLIQPFNISDKMTLTVAELPQLYADYILQECEKVFDCISWVDTEKELENVKNDKLTNLTDTINLIQFL